MSYGIAHPNGRKPPFKFSALTRVPASDTDAQGTVDDHRCLAYFVLARGEYHHYLALLDLELRGHEFVMRASTVEYLAPAGFADLIEVFIRLARIGRTSATYEFAAYRVEDDVLMVTATQTLVFVDLAERRAVEIPDALREPVRRFEGADCEIAERVS